jgi:hypothetical protein
MSATPIYDAAGNLVGVRAHETTHSLAGIAALSIDLATARNEAAELRAELARLRRIETAAQALFATDAGGAVGAWQARAALRAALADGESADV